MSQKDLSVPTPLRLKVKVMETQVKAAAKRAATESNVLHQVTGTAQTGPTSPDFEFANIYSKVTSEAAAARYRSNIASLKSDLDLATEDAKHWQEKFEKLKTQFTTVAAPRFQDEMREKSKVKEALNPLGAFGPPPAPPAASRRKRWTKTVRILSRGVYFFNVVSCDVETAVFSSYGR